MKLFKWILGIFAVLGGAAAIASTQKKKEHDKKVKKNKAQIQKVQGYVCLVFVFHKILFRFLH